MLPHLQLEVQWLMHVTVLKERNIPFVICRFHLIKAVSAHYPKDEELKKKLTKLVYQIQLSKTQSEFDETLNQLKMVDERFGEYFSKQWGKYSTEISNMGRTSSMSFQNTNNFCEAAIKKLQCVISLKSDKKKSLFNCVISLLNFMKSQTPNKTKNQISVTQAKHDAKFQLAKEKLLTNKE